MLQGVQLFSRCSENQLAAIAGPADFIGEIALLSGGPRNATVATTSEASLVVTSRQFWALLEQAPEIQRSVIRALGERLQLLAA